MSQLMDDKHLNFVLYNVLQAEDLNKYADFADHDQQTFNQAIETAKYLAEGYFLPHYAKFDENEPVFENGQVRTIAEVKTAWNEFTKSGFFTAQLPYEQGGMQLPTLIYMAANAYLTAANPASSSYPFLTIAASNVIQSFGSDSQKSMFFQNMRNGKFSGTMAMTEPNIGSSLGDLRTKAIQCDDGTYKISGQKMFISGGEQDITENIIHLVLARIEGAPQGIKGISLFIVPKKLTDENGEIVSRNDVNLVGLLHKMGHRGTTSTILNFGENNNCVGYLIGEPGQGLHYMFQMMNEARIGVGLGAAVTGYRGYLMSLDYAKNRPQGRMPSNKNSGSAQVNIVEHTDVKRMLLAQKAYVESSLTLCLYAAKLFDEVHTGKNSESEKLLDLLTPIVKSFPSAYGPKANDLAIQVLGGCGYTRDYPAEQLYRDNRLNPIHEGTVGIQSLDLLGRKIWQHEGQSYNLLKGKIAETISQIHALNNQAYNQLANDLDKYLNVLDQTTQIIGNKMKQGEPDLALANSILYLDMFGKIVISWLWLKMLYTAHTVFSSSKLDEDQNFLNGKIQAAKYFIEWELPEIEQQAKLLTSFNDACFTMKPEWF